MGQASWTSVALPLGGGAVACLALALSPRWHLRGGPLSRPTGGHKRAAFLLLAFSLLAVLSAQLFPVPEWVAWRVGFEFGGDAALLILALLPAGRDRKRGWSRAGFGPLPVPAVGWLWVFMAGLAVFRIALLTYVPCRCPALDPGEGGWGPAVALVAYMGLVAPLTEELLYRGIALPVMAERAGGWGGIVLSAVSWAMAHGERPLLPLIVLGIALGWLTLVSGSLWAALGFHAAWNWSVLSHEIYQRATGVGDGGAVAAPVIFLAVAALVLGWARLLDTARAGGLGISVARGRPDPTGGPDRGRGTP